MTTENCECDILVEKAERMKAVQRLYYRELKVKSQGCPAATRSKVCWSRERDRERKCVWKLQREGEHASKGML